MSQLKSVTNSTTARPGDVFAVTLTFHVTNVTSKGVPIVSVYRCLYPLDDPYDIPQGDVLPVGFVDAKMLRACVPLLANMNAIIDDFD